MTSPNAVGGLEELALACERATGPDRELDVRIRCAIFAPAGAYVEQSQINGAWCVYEIGFSGKPRSWESRGLSQEQRLGSFTASLDAAMTLVPEGYWWTVGHVMGPQMLTRDLFWATCHSREAQWPYERPTAATPALALCAANLRARALASEQVQQ